MHPTFCKHMSFCYKHTRIFCRYILSLYVAHISDSRAQESDSSINQDITALVSGLAAQFKVITSNDQIHSFRESIRQTFQNESMPMTYSWFKSYMDNLVKKHDTLRFWYQFTAEDCFAYISLFIALRYRNLDLRTGGMKLLAAVYSAFDRPTYQELIPRHLKDLLTICHQMSFITYRKVVSVSAYHQLSGMGSL